MDVNRDEVVKLLLTKTERAAWEAAADAAGLKLSEWIRRRVNGTQTVTTEAPPAPAVEAVAKPTTAKPKRAKAK